mmetsp:Transcript_6573/g.19892  ORF Transcript_6573/g.19892 Transcript_6573/m.19892 type:complete len:201 (-) Transcript_6573:127-729(-)
MASSGSQAAECSSLSARQSSGCASGGSRDAQPSSVSTTPWASPHARLPPSHAARRRSASCQALALPPASSACTPLLSAVPMLATLARSRLSWAGNVVALGKTGAKTEAEAGPGTLASKWWGGRSRDSARSCGPTREQLPLAGTPTASGVLCGGVALPWHVKPSLARPPGGTCEMRGSGVEECPESAGAGSRRGGVKASGG